MKPETRRGKTILSQEKQYELLIQRLTGHRAFSYFRGKVGDLFKDVVAECDSPTAFKGHWERRVAALEVLGCILAQYKRDGHHFAYEALFRALHEKEYRIPGELVPAHELTPVTIFMPDPIKTLSLICWLLTSQKSELKRYAEGKDCSGATTILVQSLPSLPKLISGHQSGLPLEDTIPLAYQNDVLSRYSVPEDWVRLSLCDSQFSDRFKITPFPFAFVVVGETQESVLRKFDVTLRDRIAVWQVNCPQSLLSQSSKNGPRVQIGFHARSDHEFQTGIFRSLVSQETAHNFGIRILESPQDLLHTYSVRFQGQEGDGEFRFVSAVTNL